MGDFIRQSGDMAQVWLSCNMGGLGSAIHNPIVRGRGSTTFWGL